MKKCYLSIKQPDSHHNTRLLPDERCESENYIANPVDHMVRGEFFKLK